MGRWQEGGESKRGKEYLLKGHIHIFAAKALSGRVIAYVLVYLATRWHN